MQDKATLGTRYTCFECSCKFYDLNRPEPICPKCGVDQVDDPAPDSRVAAMSKVKEAKAAAKAAAKKAPKKEAPAEEVDADADDASADGTLDIDDMDEMDEPAAEEDEA